MYIAWAGCGTAEASKSYFGRPVYETIVAGDINGDCRVNFKDFALAGKIIHLGDQTTWRVSEKVVSKKQYEISLFWND